MCKRPQAITAADFAPVKALRLNGLQTGLRPQDKSLEQVSQLQGFLIGEAIDRALAKR